MAGTKEGGKLCAATNIKKYGPDFYRNIGRKGGQQGRGHTFAHGRVNPSEAGRIGGTISRRTKKD